VKYMLLHYVDESIAPNPDENAHAASALAAWIGEMEGRGVLVQGDRLRPVADATTVRVRDGEVVVFDGPFAETKEQVAGFDVIDCADLAEAIEVASKHPDATFGTIEVRPFWPL
jgi:hypothetical protein